MNLLTWIDLLQNPRSHGREGRLFFLHLPDFRNQGTNGAVRTFVAWQSFV